MTTTYMFSKANRRNIISVQRECTSIIKSFLASRTLGDKIGFSTSLMGKPLFTVTPDKVTIKLFYYSLGGAELNTGTQCYSNDQLSLLGNALTQCWESSICPVNSVELQVIRLNHSILDSSIFAQYLTSNAGKYSFNRIFDMLKNSIPTVNSEGSLDETLNPSSHITGVKVKLSGRLTTQRSAPRQTVQAGRIGSSAKGFYGVTDYSQYTSKNKLGAFTMKVWISQQSR